MSHRDFRTEVDEFLSKGRLSADEGTIAEACNKSIVALSRTSLIKARLAAQQFRRQAQPHSVVLRLAAARALARILHLSGNYREAEQHYLEARRLARNESRTRALIDRSLIDLYMYLDRVNESRRRARMAARVFEKAGALDDLAKTYVNLGNVFHRQDRHREAEKLYRQAGDHFETAGDLVAAARCYYNRANTLLQLFDVDKSLALYKKAERIWRDAGFELDENDARYGQAWLLMLTGEFHRALILLADCEERYRDAGHTKMAALCCLDRSEVYLALNLFEDARQTARDAEKIFGRLKLTYESAKAAFFRAHAAAGSGNTREVYPAVRKARDGFVRAGNSAFAAAAEHLEHIISARKGLDTAKVKRLRRRFEKAQLPLWEAICDLQLVRQPRSRIAAFDRLAQNGAVKHVPHLYAAYKTELGDEHYRQGNVTQARKSWQQAANRLDTLRAHLPPIEIRNTFAKGRGEPHRRLIDTELDRQPATAAAWSERLKTAGIWSPLPGWMSEEPSRRQVELNLAALAARVENLQRTLNLGSGSRSSPVAERPRIVARLQQEIRRQMAFLEKSGSPAIESIDRLEQQFASISKSLPVVQFHCSQDDLIAFIHDRGSVKIQRWDRGLKKLSEYSRHWRFLLEAELVAERLGRVGSVAKESSLLERIGEWLWSPLEIRSSAKQILILPDGELANLPWLGMQIGGQALVEKHAIVQAPSLRHFLRAGSITTKSNRVRIFAGVSHDLPAARDEMLSLKTVAGPDAKVYDPCRRENWPYEGDYLLWHYAGHANLRAENPFYSYIGLDDGPLFAADFRLRQARVALVTLAACRSGQQVAPPGEEHTGLVRSLLEMGARNVIAGHWPVADRSTALWMSAFYNMFFEKQPIQSAMKHATLTVREKYPSAYHWAAYSVFGAGK